MAFPSKYKPAMCQQVKDLMAEGMSRKATAVELGISYKTFLSYIERHEDFAAAVEQGDVLAEAWWEDKYIRGALGQAEVQPAMMIMYMKNRFKWRDKLEQTVTKDELETVDEWLAARDSEADSEDED